MTPTHNPLKNQQLNVKKQKNTEGFLSNQKQKPNIQQHGISMSVSTISTVIWHHGRYQSGNSHSHHI
jgi:hypothetical protein